MLSPSSDCRERMLREGGEWTYTLCFPPVLSQAPLAFGIMTCWGGCFLHVYPQCISLAWAFPASPWIYLNFQDSQYVAMFSLTGTHWVKSSCLPLFWMWLPWLLIEGARSAWAVNQQRMIICLSAVYIIAALTQDVLRFQVALDTLLLNPVGIWPLISGNCLSFRTVKHLIYYWYDFCC